MSSSKILRSVLNKGGNSSSMLKGKGVNFSGALDSEDDQSKYLIEPFKEVKSK